MEESIAKGKRPISILVVDDDERLRHSIAENFRAQNVYVVEARDGHDAVFKAENDKFDAIISDIEMPKMSGDKAIRLIKRTELNGITPVFVLSGALDAPVVVSLRGLIIRAFVKPLDPIELANHVLDFLKKIGRHV